MALLRALIITGMVTIAIAAKFHPLSDEFINHINDKQSSWKAGRNFPQNTPMTHLKRLAGVYPNFKVKSLPSIKHDADLIASLPESFDARNKWPNCPSLNEIRDQGSCGSCWAFGAVEAMTDRVCIYSNGTQQFHFSAEDLVTCCSECGEGCHGGSIEEPWLYWQTTGLVSGGNYKSNQYCRPYTIPECEHLEPDGNIGYSAGLRKQCINHLKVKTPKCKTSCNANYKVKYADDKRFAKKVYVITGGEDHIKAEIFKNGPVETAFWVFTDFFHYKSGVYEYEDGDFVYGHAIKLMGWGVEDGVDYWLVANSWNTNWGDKGFFKILRGVNHLNIERIIVAGEPLLNVG